MHTQCYSKKSAFPHACLQDWEHNQQQSQPGVAAGGDLPLPLWREWGGGVKAAGKPAASVVSLVQGLGIGLFFFFFFLVAHPFRCGAVCPCAAEQGVLLQCHNQVSCEQQPRSCSPTKHSCSQVCQQVLVCRKQQRWY